MAIPQGNFVLGGAGITSPGGAYAYAEFSGFPHYFAGTFFIDTGYDDPVAWTNGVEAAELYGARVYARAGVCSPGGLGAGTYMGKWHLVATPVWQSKFWVLPHSNTLEQRRILIRVDAYLLEPVDESSGAYQRLDNVDWSLYRL